MLRYLHRKTVQPRRRDTKFLLHRAGGGGDEVAGERKLLPEIFDGRSEDGWSCTSVASELRGAGPCIKSTYIGEEYPGENPLSRGFVPQCTVCRDLNLHSLPLSISMTSLADLLLAHCPACLMLHTVLQPYEEIASDFVGRYVQVSTCEGGLRVSYTGLAEVFVLQGVQGYPNPWPSVPEHVVVHNISNPDVAAETISQWLEVCEVSHACSQVVATALLPTRVLEILTPNRVRLHLSTADQTGPYACLSHCWGGSVPLQLTSGTLQSFQDEIPWQHLPLTFQHAIVMAKKLDIKYLWIDSLCILQDDYYDWLEEGSKMAAIYSGAILTMAATASSDSTRGLWLSQERSSNTSISGYPEVHCFTSPDGSAYKIRARFETEFDIIVRRYLPLQRRAWFFQEWILSPRVVHFTDSVLCWECSEVQQLDDGTYFTNSNDRGGGKKSTLASLTQTPPGSSKFPDEETFQIYTWHALVRIYSDLQLTYSADIFPALQGVTTRIASGRKCRFYAGLWEHSLVVDLLWRLVEPSPTIEYRAPSWSWASRCGEVVWQTWRWLFSRPTIPTPEVSILSITTETTGENPFGQVSGGSMVLRGLCLPVSFGPQKDYRKRPILRVKLNRADRYDDLLDLDNEWRWSPDDEHDPAPSADVLMMLIGLWSFHNTQGKLVHESWFLVFERAGDVGDVYKRIGLYWTEKLAYRARFRREAIEQELTII